MTPRRSYSVLMLVTLTVAGFIAYTARTMMPAQVASHFGADNVADGYLPRGEYVAWFLGFAVLFPLLMAVVPGILITRFGGAGINLPGRDYWLAPERQAETLAFFEKSFCWVAAFTSLFVGYNHWLTVRANQMESPALPATALGAGMAVFFLVGPVFLVVVALRFSRRR